MFVIGLSFKHSGLDLDRKIWQSAHLWHRLLLLQKSKSDAGSASDFSQFLSLGPNPGSKEKRRILPESTAVLRIHGHFWYIKSSDKQIRYFCIPNPVQYFYFVVQNDPNAIVLFKCLIRSGLYPKKNSD